MSVATNRLLLGSRRVLPDGVFNARLSSVTVNPLSLLEIPTVSQKRFRVASAPKGSHEFPRCPAVCLQCLRLVSDTTVPSGADEAVTNALEHKPMFEKLTRGVGRESNLCKYIDEQDANRVF